MPFYASAHQLMLTFNCVGLPGQGRTVQNVPDDCANAHFLTAPITASHLAKLSATAAAVDSTNYGLQYLSAGDGAEPESINDLAQLDAKLAKLIMAGEKVVLLGDRVQIEPRAAVSEQDHDEINRKPLAIDGATGGDWFSFPEKAFPDCGLIKLDPNLKVIFNTMLITQYLKHRLAQPPTKSTPTPPNGAAQKSQAMPLSPCPLRLANR